MKLIRRISTTLHKPHPTAFTAVNILLPGAIVGLLLFTLGLDQYTLVQRLLFALLFGALTSCCAVATVLALRWLFPRQMDGEGWILGKELLLYSLILLVIALANYIALLGFNHFGYSSLPPFTTMVLSTVGIGIFPITILVLYEQYSLEKSRLAEAQRLNRRLVGQLREHKSSSRPKLVLHSENGKPEVQLPPEALILLKADGNYVELFFEGEDGGAQRVLIRNRLKRLMNQLPGSQFFHCHKSYAVNGRRIVRVTGNARNYELEMKGADFLVPVSRAKSGELAGFLEVLA